MSRGRNEYIHFKDLGVSMKCWKGLARCSRQELNPKNKKEYYKCCTVNEITLTAKSPFSILGIPLRKITESNTKSYFGEEYLFTEYEGEKTFWDIPIKSNIELDLEFKFDSKGFVKSVVIDFY